MDNKKFINDSILHEPISDDKYDYLSSRRYQDCGDVDLFYNRELDFGSCNHKVSYEEYLRMYTEGDYYHLTKQNDMHFCPYSERFNHDYKISQIRIEEYSKYFDVHNVKSFLDIGCSNGAFVHSMSELGIEKCYGMDANAFIISKAIENSSPKCNFIVSSFENDYDKIGVEHELDCVTLHDVIEHFYYPIKALQNIKNLLTKNAYLILDTPDLRQGINGDIHSWKHFKDAQHPFFYTEDSLDYLMNSVFENYECLASYIPIPQKIVKIYRVGE